MSGHVYGTGYGSEYGADPAAGDRASIRVAAARFATGAAGLRDRISHVEAARSSFAGAEGEFAESFLQTTGAVTAKLATTAAAWDEAAGILHEYVQALDEIAAETLRVRWRLRSAEDAVGPLRFFVPSQDTEAGRRLAEVQAELAVAEQQLAALMVDRAELDAHTAARMNGIGLVADVSFGGGSDGVRFGAAMWVDERIVSAGDLAALGDPALIAAAWAKLSAQRQQELLEQSPGVLGALGGIPALVRVAANRMNAAARIEWIDRELARVRERGYGSGDGTPYSDDAAVAEYLERIRDLEAERGYLARVVAGDVNLYLYEPDDGAVIEVFGDPATASAILSFMPGTNTSMESFYESTPSSGLTALTRWQVENASSRHPVAGFVVKQGEFPQLGGNILATGPQNNDMAEALGAKYVTFAAELSAIAPHAPVVSVEHSFGSAVGGVAETSGAGFDARVMLAGIGMTSDWRADPRTDHYAMQAPNDVNRHLDGAQAWNWGYAITPSQSNGITELDSGIAGTPAWVQVAAVLSPPVAVVADVISGVEHHGQIISADPGANQTVIRNLQAILEGAHT